MKFFVGVPEPAWAHRFEHCFISVARLRRRKGPFTPPSGSWAMDSAAFSEVALTGGYRMTPGDFALEAGVWVMRVPGCEFVASQDYMCEPFVLAKTGLSVVEHQRLTVDRYDQIAEVWDGTFGPAPETPILPVLQGFKVREYLDHLDAYGDRLTPGMWVGVGSVCKRQGSISLVEDLLAAIKEVRPDLRLHGFGVKLTALRSPMVRDLLYSADSMAWSFAARKRGDDPNDWREAEKFVARVAEPPPLQAQPTLFGWV